MLSSTLNVCFTWLDGICYTMGGKGKGEGDRGKGKGIGGGDRGKGRRR